ncbi:MAG: MotA/TolQ/ExbB proton channel family protein [Candidatus Brocadia sp.]|nr:MotA/TolQ/ExbB proton channel family protein [Candidatus Brocadia sp.]
MNLLNLLQNILSVLSSAMLYPVMILLVILFVWMIITLGGFVSECFERKRQAQKQNPNEFIKSFSQENLLRFTSQEIPRIPFCFQEYFRELVNELKRDKRGREIRIEYLLQSKEQKMTKSLDKLRLMIRVGPTLGLMGTIIPMGPALSALSQGDLEKLSSNIIIAFTTTVVGLAIGIAAYCLSTAKNRWVNDDIKNLEYFTECVMKNEQ